MVKNLHHIARTGFSLLVALTIALPGVGFSAAANQAWATVQQRAVNDPVPTTLAEAKTNLDTANSLKSTAADEEAKAKAALDAAKATHESATNEHAANASMLDQATSQANAKLAEVVAKAQSEYEDAAAKVDEYTQDYNAASQKKAQAEANRDQAEAEYNAAQAAYDAKVAEVANNGNAELQAAYSALREAEDAYEQATTQYKDAANEYKAADSERKDVIAAYNAARSKVTECEAAVAAAQAKVDAAQAALDAARGKLSTAADDEKKATLQAAVTEAQSKLDAAKSEKTTAQGRLATAQSEQTAAQKAVDDAEAALEAAKANMGGVDIDALQAAVDEAQLKYDAAKAAYDSGAQSAGVEKSYQQALADKIAAENAFNEADALVTSTRDKLEAAQKELAAITAGGGGNQEVVLSVKEFFDEQDSIAASALFDSMWEASLTHSGSPGDATDFEFVQRSLDMIENLNSIRTSKGLPDLRVSDALMAYTIISLNWASFDHIDFNQSSPCELFAYSGDNSSWASYGLVNDWYDNQKTTWDNALATNMYMNSSYAEESLPEGWSTMTPEELFNACEDFYLQVRAYVNIVAPTNIYVGVAANHLADRDYAYAAKFTDTTEGQTYSVAEWKTRFELWVQTKKTAAGNIAAAATDEEIAAAQQKVNKAQEDFNNASADRTKKNDALVAASLQFTAAESIKHLEDALASADATLASAKQAHEDAKNSVGDLTDPNHPLNVAIANANATLAAKKQAVTSIQNELTALDSKITTLQTERDNAQTALDNYSAVDTSAQEAALAAAQRELDRAKLDLEAARAEVSDLAPKVAEWNSKCQELVQKQTTIRTTQLTPTKKASDDAKRAYDNLLRTTQENSDYREMLKMKNTLDSKREAFTNTLYTIADQQTAMTTAQRQITESTTKKTAAETKLSAAKQLSIESIMANPLGDGDYSEFLVLNDHAQNVKDAQVIAQPTANRVNAAKADLDAKQAAYDAARAKHVSATADRDEAQRIYNSFLAQNTDPANPSNPSDSSNPTNPGNSSSDPVVEPWNPGSSNGAASGSGSKGSSSKATNAAGNGEAADAEAVAEDTAADASTNTVSNAPYVAKPKTVAAQGSIVGPLIIAVIVGVLLVAVGVAIMISVRRRHAAAAAGAAGVAGAGVSAAGAVGADASGTTEASANDSTTSESSNLE
ncbi:hypothetical protein [Anaerotardibacter muris]|uniref:hypothetical protein n=1 Tax=Anaerotardibacter muris TaxID=2941505 RepID=UPI00203D1624|nr:hypothetical protein [Anaerotardibacter muris]